MSRTVAEKFGRGILVKFGQLHPAFVAIAAGEALERSPQKTPLDPFWRYVSPKSWCQS